MPLRRPNTNNDTKEAKILANRYEVVKKLGSGNFGTVFVCKDRQNTEEDKVVKEIYVGDLQPDETVDANHEARLLSRLKHPNIVKYFDSFVDTGGEYFCIITEYCEGGDLDVKITEVKKKKSHLDESTVLNWFVQLVLAVKYLHSQRVLHRDLKARNIFLRKNKVKIGDFGISRILMSASDYASTFTGTPFYMSPEVLKHEGYNSKSDIWSVGCILYEMCALEHAFDGQGLMAIMYKIVEGVPPDLPKRYSKQLNDVFKGIIIKEPEKRPSATEITHIPFIAQHMSQMKDILSDEVHCKSDPGTIDARDFHRYVSEKAHLGEMQPKKQPQKKEKLLTPSERMKLNKLRKVEEERSRLSQHAKENFLENQERKSEIRNTMSKTIAPVWVGGEGEGESIKKMLSRGSAKIHKERQATTLSEADLIRRLCSRDDNEDETDDYHQQSYTLNSRPSLFEDRPITPMKNTMVYDRLHSTLDFEDGIPKDPDLAETYYSQYDDEFENPESPSISTPDDDDEDEKTIVNKGNTVYEKANSTAAWDNGERTFAGDETQDLIGCLEGALHSNVNETVVNDDTGFCGPASRELRIQNMREQCIKKLGAVKFEEVYEFIKKERSKDKLNTTNIAKGLKKLVKNVYDCFLVEQLYFYETET
ncbi:serine/threonine-protein kinase Nek11-like isoform X1 [Patella vulgata]|uniref:serine/threonine-protein kinase Nek11-like isoform X1 n=2 Tax=Patella vulgata TaxID=6465 RepID=UPI0024A8E9A2|nr:serine/threonine-protein kinase Nek11-like isoform X1 [Patella vulgata]